MKTHQTIEPKAWRALNNLAFSHGLGMVHCEIRVDPDGSYSIIVPQRTIALVRRRVWAT